MKTLGIITEYNPFHKGHTYMIEEAKRKAGADRVVVVMSGSFVQRGEPAIFDKWTRAEAALKNGVDMVLELPVLFAASKAETFGGKRHCECPLLRFRKRRSALPAGGSQADDQRNRRIPASAEGAAG